MMDAWIPPNDKYPPPKIGEPPLHRAARMGDHASIAALVREGADINAIFDIALDPAARERPATPLMVAAGSGDGATVETVCLLLQLGADPMQAVGAQSAATIACTGLGWNYRPGGDAERLRVLLEAGSPLPDNPEASNRLLCDVAKSGDSGRMSVLLEYGLNPRGHWDVDAAKDSGRNMMAEMEKHRQAQPDIFKSMPDAARALLEEQMKKSADAMFDRSTSAPWSHEIPLFRAAKSGNADCVRLLLDAGADPMARDNSKRTAIYHAVSAAVVELLLASGLSIEDADEYGWSPLQSAVGDGESALARIEALLEAGADVNATTDRGYTIFMSAVASMERHPTVMRRLVESGADPHAVSELGYNAYHAAIDVNGEANAEESVRDTLGYIKELGVDIEHRNNRGLTPLGRAIEEGTGIEVRVLCELGANPNAVCPKHQCGGASCDRLELPLLFHAVDGIGVHKDMKTESLLKAGASPIAKDQEGYSPLARVVATLCGDAADFAGNYSACFNGLKGLRLDRMPMAKSREDFIAEASTPLRTYVERFAAQIPVSETSEYSKLWRAEQLNCIVLLCAYEAWIRHSNP